MKFTTNTSALKPILQKLGIAVTSKPVLPVLGCICVTILKKKVLLTTTDLNLTITCELACETEGKSGVFLLPFAELKKLIALEEEQPVTLTCDPVNGLVHLMSEYDTFCLGKPGNYEDYPQLPQVDDSNMFALNGSFLPSLAMAALSVSTDELRPQLCAICVELSPTEVNIVSTDAHSLYHRRMEVDLKINTPTELLIPARVAKVMDGLSECQIGYNSSHVLFATPEMSVCTLRTEGKYAAWRTVMPAHQANVQINLINLQTALEKAVVVADLTTSGVDLMPGKTDLTIKAMSEDTEMSATCNIPAQIGSENEGLADCSCGQIRVNGRLFNRALKQINGHMPEAGDITLGITEANRAITLRIAGKDELTLLAMPIIIN
jgi:DNA polymerase III subunit beta